MPRRFLKSVWKLFGCLKVVCRVSEIFRKVSGRCLDAFLMSGMCLKGVWKVFGHLKVICRVSERFRKVSGGCLKVSGCFVDVWKVFEGSLEGIFWSESCLEVSGCFVYAWKVSEWCLEGECL